MTPRTLKILAVTYAVKTLLIGIAWLAIPNLPERATAKAHEVWTSILPETAK